MTTSTVTPPVSLPKLRHGERLDREEFHRRYENMPEVKAELLDGVVYIMSSPVSYDHADPHGDLMGWLYHYKAFTPGVGSGNDATLRLSNRSEPQPDVCLRIKETHGGNSHIDEDGYLAGVPELLGEVGRSSASYDRTVKMPIYRQAGVRELILWRVDDGEIDWFVLRDGNYEALIADQNGVVHSETFPGLWLDVPAMLRFDASKVLNVLQQGIASPEHATFVDDLKKAEARDFKSC